MHVSGSLKVLSVGLLLIWSFWHCASVSVQFWTDYAAFIRITQSLIDHITSFRRCDHSTHATVFSLFFFPLFRSWYVGMSVSTICCVTLVVSSPLARLLLVIAC
ncbi:hypothetical protein RSAG8_13672, partial [Rhizoctonia solani AG-8 WAC10335]